MEWWTVPGGGTAKTWISIHADIYNIFVCVDACVLYIPIHKYYIYIYTRTHIRIHAPTYFFWFFYLLFYSFTFVIEIYIYIYVCVCVNYIYIYIHIHIYVQSVYVTLHITTCCVCCVLHRCAHLKMQLYHAFMSYRCILTVYAQTCIHAYTVTVCHRYT